MIDILPRLEALERAGVRPDKYLVDGYRPFQRQSLQALGISQDRIIQPHDHLLLEPSKLYTITRDNPDGRRRVGPWLARALHAGYVKLRVKDEEANVAKARLLLFTAVKRVLASGMELLGIKPLERM